MHSQKRQASRSIAITRADLETNRKWEETIIGFWHPTGSSRRAQNRRVVVNKRIFFALSMENLKTAVARSQSCCSQRPMRQQVKYLTHASLRRATICHNRLSEESCQRKIKTNLISRLRVT